MMHFFLTRSILRSRNSLLLIIVLCTLNAASPAWAQAPQPGLANGFEIDGNLLANSPGSIIGLGNDWLIGPPGPGIAVLHPDGTAVDPLMTLHFLDGIKNDDLDVFASSNKVLDNPNSYEWKDGSVPQKDDIENGLVHFSRDALGDMWIILAGDRRSVSGDSYIDFEFLQNTLVMNDDLSFTSDGPHAGRTVGDVLLTVRLINGGTYAEFYAQEWAPDGLGGYTYVDVPFPPGAAFVAANTDSQVVTTFDAFGSNEYSVNQLGEAAINLTVLLPSFDKCYALATVFIRTKSSASADAELKDFIRPIQVNKCLDMEPPSMTFPADVTVTCGASIIPDDIGIVTAIDNCSPEPAIAYSDSVVSGNCTSTYTIHRHWSATDDCGNSSYYTQIITVVDNTPPVVLSAPGPVTVQCVDEVPPPDPGAIMATDDCSSVNVAHVSDVSNDDPCHEVITRTYMVDDGCGNTTPVVQLITIEDTTPPQVQPLSDITVQCADLIPDFDIGIVNASDNCSNVTISHVEDTSDGNTCPERIVRTYRVTDRCGNSMDVTQNIIVMDTTPPQITGPDDIMVTCHDAVPAASIGLITASDNCGSVVIAHINDSTDDNSCPETITRTYRATDNCGNTADWIQKIIIHDSVPPVVEALEDISVQCASAVPSPDENLVVASDNCSEIAVQYVNDVSDGLSCPETITRTYRVMDACGNMTDVTQTIRIHDTIAPEITAPQDVVVQCRGAIPSPNIGLVRATDNCDRVWVEHIGDDSNMQSCPEVITRRYRATDACGNTAECTQIITVDDTTPPLILTTLEPFTVQCADDVPPPMPNYIRARDNCSDVNVIHLEDVSDGNTCPEVITRTYRVYDACGNHSDLVQQITIHDDVPPVLSACGPDQNLECPTSIAFQRPTATDNCDKNPAVFIAYSDSIIGPWTYSVTRTYQAVDQCGNASSECSQSISARCEGRSLCTVTQGFWGNYGGYYNGEPTIEIIRNLLADPLVVGKPGRSLKINQNAADCIVARLPAGKTPTTLPPIGNANLHHSKCQSNPELPLDSNGKFENVFLGQVITLSLNTRLSFWLSFMPLSECFCTQRALPGPDGLLGTGDDVLDENDTPRKYYITEEVLDALDTLELPRLVAGLLELANRALADMDTGGARISMINAAVDVINNAFDKCRFLVDCDADIDTRFAIHDRIEEFDLDAPAAESLPTAFNLLQNCPNPFNPSTSIRYDIPTAGQVTLKIYDVAGTLVKVLEQRYLEPGRYEVGWSGENERGDMVSSGIYFYQLRAPGFSQTRKMILLK